MTNINTELEKRFQRYRHESIQPSEPEPYIHVGLHHACQFSDLISDILTEKEKSYQEGVAAERDRISVIIGESYWECSEHGREFIVTPPLCKDCNECLEVNIVLANLAESFSAPTNTV